MSITDMKRLNPKHTVLFLYHLIIGSIIATNIHPNQWLMGWDGLYPELNIPLNIMRGLSAGWQEYYGAGLVGGHGFAATLPHTLIIGLLSFILPQQLLRQTFIFLCYYLGGLGMMFVSHKLIQTFFHRDEWGVSLIASLYYLLNLGTIQTFYTPLEAFIVHFTTFPWLTYFTIRILETPKRKLFALFFLTLLFSSIQGFIPAVFVTYGISLLSLTGIFLLFNFRNKQVWKTVTGIWVAVLAANAYWIAPVVYFTVTNATQYVHAYNNLTTTPQFTALSIKYGSLPYVATLKSFLWQSNELGGPIMQAWITHNQLFLVNAIGILLFTFVLIGAISLLTAKHKELSVGLLLSSLYIFGNIAVDIPPFSTLIHSIHAASPDLAQVFRVTFTKFGIALDFHYALLFSLGIAAIIPITKRIHIKRSHPILLAVITAGVLCYGFPVWQSELIYQKLFVELPKPYTQTINALNALPPGKIADFPQDCSEGWYNTLWKYFGSGFLWYGVKQPFMARAFDVWSKNNENYYWELSTALRQNDYKTVERIFDKYSIRYVLYDQNITHCRTQTALLSSLDFGNFISSSANYKKISVFSAPNVLPISTYERMNGSVSPITIGSLPNVTPPYSYADTDPAYATTAGYLTDSSKLVDLTRYANYFSKRGIPLNNDELTALNLSPIQTIAGPSFSPNPCDQNQYPVDRIYAGQTAFAGTLRLTDTNTTTCATTQFSDINTSLPYVLRIQTTHLAGEPLFLSVLNKGRSTGLEILLPTYPARDPSDLYYYLAPSFQSEITYTVSVRNSSYNRNSSINDLHLATLYSITSPTPAPFMYQSNSNNTHAILNAIPDSHPISWLYTVTAQNTSTSDTVILNQSYDQGWIAIANGRLLKHILVNNWENGWMLDNTKGTIVILFWPQLLEFAGFALLIGVIVKLASKGVPLRS